MQRLSHQAARAGARAAYQPKPKADFKEWVDPDQPGAMAPGMQAHQAALAHAAPAAGRARLCTRVTRWICGGAALLGLVGGAGWVLSGRGSASVLSWRRGTTAPMAADLWSTGELPSYFRACVRSRWIPAYLPNRPVIRSMTLR